MKINELFNESDLNRKIEKVISYAANSEANLREEISEYIATDKLEQSFQKLLEAMQRSMDDSNQNEIGVWISGFYGSGKSSFSKYFGLSFDENSTVDNIKFKDIFRDRLNSAQTKALLNNVTNKFPAEVIMVDLASTQIVGNETAQISRILFDTTLRKYGYSTNRKVFDLEKRLEKNDILNDFKKAFKEQTGDDWENSNNDLILLDAFIPKLAHKFLPNIFTDENSFNTTILNDVSDLTDESAKLMIEIIKEKSGKDNIIFVLDEVGQYLGNNNNLTLNLDGLAKNLKQIGNGSVWLIATAQQTLTEDVSFENRPDIFRLKDRFPIQIQLASTDINEIIQKRLLKKSLNGVEVCKNLFATHGQKIIQKTKLDADFYQNQHIINEKSFCDFYPFFPAQFEILLQLLSALARATGGIGLRSAIKVVQDVLKGTGNNQIGFGNNEVGWIANIVNLFDILEDDIYTSFNDKKNIMDIIKAEFYENKLVQDIVKSIIILDLIPGIKTNRKNLIALLYNDVTSDLNVVLIEKEIENIVSNNKIPIKEDNNILSIITPKLQVLIREMDEIPINTGDKKRTFNRLVQEFISPLEGNLKGSLNSNVKIKSGLKILDLYSDQIMQVDGENQKIQTIIYFVDDQNYEQRKQELLTTSIQQSDVNFYLYIVAKKDEKFEDLLNKINKSSNLSQKYINENDSETREYLQNLLNDSKKLENSLKMKVKEKLEAGSIIYKGNVSAVTDLQKTINEILSKSLNDTYYKFKEADHNVSTDLAEKFLKASSNLNTLNPDIDPLKLVDKSTGDAEISIRKPCFVSIRDYLENSGRIDAETLRNKFREPPYYWSPDTLRYILAAMLVGSQIEIYNNSKKITEVSNECIDLFKTNQSFKKCSINLKSSEITNDQKRHAKDALVFLTGRSVVATNQDIAKHAKEYAKKIENTLPILENNLQNIGINKDQNFKNIKANITQLINNPEETSFQFFGIPQTQAFILFNWISSVENKFNGTIKKKFEQLNEKFLFATNTPNFEFYDKLKEEMKSIQVEFENEKNEKEFWDIELDNIDQKIDELFSKFSNELKQENNILINNNTSLIKQIPSINYISLQELNNQIYKFSKFSTEDKKILESDIDPIQKLKKLISNNTLIVENYNKSREQITSQIDKIIENKIIIQKKNNKGKYVKVITLKKNITEIKDLNKLIEDLNELKIISNSFDDFDLNFKIEDD